LTNAALLLVPGFMAVLLIHCSQYPRFTPIGWDWISGVQGRYFLPLLSLIASAFPWSTTGRQFGICWVSRPCCLDFI